jgi:hypothetical protein
MVADMARGGAAIKELQAKFDALGGGINEKQAVGLRDLGNRIKDLKVSLHGLAMQVVAALGPTLIDMAQRAAKWIGANKDLIAGALTAALKVVAGLFEGIGKVVSWLGDMIHKALGGDDGAIAIVIGLAAAVASVLIPVLWGMAAPIIAASVPLLAIAAIVAGLAYAIIKLGPLIRENLGKAWDWVRDKAKEAWHAVIDPVIDGVHAIEDFASAAMRWFETLWTRLKKFAYDAAQSITDAIHKIPGIGMLADLGEAIGGKAADRKFERTIDPTVIGKVVTAAPSTTTNHTANVNVGPTTINVDGSKDPHTVAGAIADAIEQMHRHAYASAGGS